MCLITFVFERGDEITFLDEIHLRLLPPDGRTLHGELPNLWGDAVMVFHCPPLKLLFHILFESVTKGFRVAGQFRLFLDGFFLMVLNTGTSPLTVS